MNGVLPIPPPRLFIFHGFPADGFFLERFIKRDEKFLNLFALEILEERARSLVRFSATLEFVVLRSYGSVINIVNEKRSVMIQGV